MLLAGFVYKQSFIISVEVSAYFPRLAAIALFSLSFLLTANVIVRSIKEAKDDKDTRYKGMKEVIFAISSWIAILIYILLFKFLGFFPASTLFLISSMIALGQRNWRLIASIVIGIQAILYVVFVSILHTRL